MTDHDRRALSVHEASHAVAAAVLGVPFTGPSIQATEGSLGRVLVHLQHAAIEDDVVISLAGPAGESLFRGRPNPSWSAGDLRQANSGIELIRSDLKLRKVVCVHERNLGYFEKQATDLVRQHWAWVDVVSRGLLLYEMLASWQVHHLRR